MNYINLQTLQYPITEQEIRNLNPNVSYPSPFKPEGYAVVFPSPQPAHNQVIEYCKEIAPVLTSKGNWEQQWGVLKKYSTPEEEAVAIQEDTKAKAKVLVDSIVQQVQLRLDTFAKTKNYDGILSACTYATSANHKFKAEGQYCVEARDNTWAILYQILEGVQEGTRPAPSAYQDIEPELPILAWSS